jgi:hypothetical protein
LAGSKLPDEEQAAKMQIKETDYDRGFLDGVATRQKVRAEKPESLAVNGLGETISEQLNRETLAALRAQNARLKGVLMFACAVMSVFVLVYIVLWVAG